MVEKLITIKVEEEGKPLEVEIIGDWKAKEIPRIYKALVLAYRRKKASIRKENIKEEEE